MRTIHVLFIAVAFTLFLFTPIAPAVTPLSDPAALTANLYTNPAPTVNARLGSAAAVHGNYLLMGAHRHNNDKGACHLYNKTPDNRWELEETKTFSLGSAQFGGSVAINDTYFFVGGMYYDNGAYSDAGAVAMYGKNALGNWKSLGMLYPGDLSAQAYFGNSLALHEHYLAVGSFGHNGKRGAVYIFTNSAGTWTQTARLAPGDLAANNWFGDALAMNNQYLAIGAPYQSANGIASSGAVYLYKNINGTWTYQKKLTGGNMANAYFGSSVALSDKFLLIGSPYEPIDGINPGAVYVYDLSQSSTPVKCLLTAITPQDDAAFGSAVALDGNAAIVGAPLYDDDATTHAGLVTLYQYDESAGSWYTIRDLPTQSLSAEDRFGDHLAMYRNTLVCTAPYADQDVLSNAGNFYVYDLNQTWFSEGKAAGDQSGSRVGLNGTRLAASAPYRNANGLNSSGAVDIFRKHGRDWTLEQTLTEPVGSRAANNYFGYGMALGRNALIAAADLGDYGYSNNGKIYIYERSGNTWNAVYSRTGQGDNWKYGNNVAMGETHAAATRYNSGNLATYIDTFTRAGNGTWSLDPTSVSPKFGSGDIDFGCDIAIDGDWMLVGSSAYDSDRGGIHLYQWDGNRWVGKYGALGLPGSLFGAGVDVCGNLFAAGRPGVDEQRGSVRLYGVNGDSFVYYATLTAPDGVAGDRFGWSVAFANQGNTLLVSAYKKHLGSLSDVGAIYVYRKGANNSTWTYDGIIYPPDNGSLSASDYFGKDIAAAGNSLVAGLYSYDGEAGNSAGAVAQIQITPFTTPADFDGDGITDFGCYHPPSGGWYVYKSREGYWENHFGYEGTLPFVMDCDGDWKVDFGCYHSASANWYGYGTVKKFWTSAFGNPNTQSITGDFDGDGVVDLGFFDS
ncbi:MAG: hypothetical protein PHG65_08095, partial [Kiritimatiellae bacterium]|nr:hypothetical protein [Kiritimatiellia bacterium]